MASADVAPGTKRAKPRPIKRRTSACDRKGLASNPSLEGRVLVKLIIGPSGAVTSARDAGSSLPDRRVVTCIVGHMRTLRFPAPQGGSATVLYPFDLRP